MSDCDFGEVPSDLTEISADEYDQLKGR